MKVKSYAITLCSVIIISHVDSVVGLSDTSVAINIVIFFSVAAIQIQ